MPNNVAVPALTLTSLDDNDEATISHSSTELSITNSVGDTVIRNVDQKALVINHEDYKIGIFTDNPGYTVDVRDLQAGANLNLEGIYGIVTLLLAGSAQGRVGTRTDNNFSIVTGNVNRITVSSTGTVTIPGAYSELVGGTNRDLYIDSTGKIGTLVSSERYKENIEQFNPGSENPIFSLSPVSFDYKDSSLGVGVIGFTAEDVSVKMPKLASYQAYKIIGEEHIKFDRAKTKNIGEIEKKEKNVPLKTIVSEIIDFDPEELNNEEQDVIMLPETYSPTNLIPYIVAAIKYLKQEIEKLGG
jgi:hypothetical protein